MISSNEFNRAFPFRPSERYGGKEAVGSTLWLEHVDGINFLKEDGSSVLLNPQDLVNDEARIKGSPYLELGRSYEWDTLLLTKEQWLREYVLRMLPLRITGDPNQQPLLFNAELKVFTVPQELTVNPGVIEQSVITMDNEGKERDLTKEKAISFALRFIPQRGIVKDFGYYPGGMYSDYGIGALEVNSNLIRMQLHHRIYFELYRSPQDKALGPLIPPHQF